MRYIVRVVKWKPERVANVKHLIATQLPNLEVFMDVIPGLPYRSFLLACDAIADTGGVLLEDDVILCRDFPRRLDRVLQLYGNYKEVVQFFERPKVPLKAGRYPGSSFFSCLCTYYPPGVTGNCSKWFPDFKNDRPEWYGGGAVDRFISYVLMRLKRGYFFYRPSLVQHHKFSSAIGVSSGTGNRSTHRQTTFFIDDLYPDGLPELDNYD